MMTGQRQGWAPVFGSWVRGAAEVLGQNRWWPSGRFAGHPMHGHAGGCCVASVLAEKWPSVPIGPHRVLYRPLVRNPPGKD